MLCIEFFYLYIYISCFNISLYPFKYIFKGDGILANFVQAINFLFICIDINVSTNNIKR
jgi:hypothetical protein